MINLQDIKEIEADNLSDFLDLLFKKVKITAGVFDAYGKVIEVPSNANHCPCVFKIDGEYSRYGLFIYPEFAQKLIKDGGIDELCDAARRGTTKMLEIDGKKYFIGIFQYNLTEDVIAKEQGILVNKLEELEVDERFRWKPTVISMKEREEIFEILCEKCKKYLI